MFNSLDYYKQSKYNEYTKRLKEMEEKMKIFNDYKKFDKIGIKLCSFPTYNDEIKIESFKLLKQDYFSNKCSFVENKTLFDICIRNNERFKLIFNSIGTKKTIEKLYEFLDTIPKQIKLMKTIKLKIKSVEILDCYFRYYINLYLCYDLITSFLENYLNKNDKESIEFLDIIINEILSALENMIN